MHNTDLLLHKASQYLASFGKQYLQKQDDDSHTNLSWDESTKALSTRHTASGQYLLLYYSGLKIEWVNGENIYPLSLEGRSHGEICIWLHHIALRCGMDEYDFHLHYTLASGKLKQEDVYDGFDSKRAEQLAVYRSTSQETCEQAREHFGLDTEIRVWPHHFDTGGYAKLPDSEVNLGFGMAIPDSVLEDYYLYVSGYRDGKAIGTGSLSALVKGEWKQGGFEGGVLAMESAKRQDLITFFKQGIAALAK